MFFFVLDSKVKVPKLKRYTVPSQNLPKCGGRRYSAGPPKADMLEQQILMEEAGSSGMSLYEAGAEKNETKTVGDLTNAEQLAVQAVCDNRAQIRDIFIGYPGSVHDSRVFRNSPLFPVLRENCQQYYILGDSGYPCTRHLLTPYKDHRNPMGIENNFNLKLAKNRYVIEHCFGLMKQKWRQLYHIKLRKIVDIVHFIHACCVLHNLALNDGFPDEVHLIPDPVFPLVPETDDEAEILNNAAADHRNFVARHILMQYNQFFLLGTK
ncbi:unnamed protein product [Acanthoscelides obtectus]|uniref:DDE Tnp4 domain-containing protein n=1 Tax=Acanthoscelides obtectus TaxID=200917 RepID=A0A9P0M5Y6_ACAOB|nr:unnamed protein product [Acanthoscelides obtectus]CAK1628371.1 Putative nuclease HARBI1 [Acanthoscelides obtectus]